MTDKNYDEMCRRYEKGHRRGKIAGGLFVITAGVLFLAREMGADLPSWIFTWKAFLIGFGLVMAVKHGFRHPGWMIPILIGTAFLVADLYPEFSIKPFLWPVLLILVGLFIIFKPRNRRRRHHWNRWHHPHRKHDYNFDTFNVTSDEEFIDSTSVFGGVKKTVLSKKFRGADITNVFGGSEINLTQADFPDTVTMEITQVFGGTKLIIPMNWEIKSKLVTVCGGLEDKRPVPLGTGGPVRTLILEGTTFFGGIEIVTY